MDINKLAKAYTNIRDARNAKKKEFEAEDAKLKANLTRLEAEMLRVLQDSNVESMRTDAGTFYRQTDVIPRAEDWDAFYAWVAEHNAFEALEKRIKKTFVTEYMESHEGTLPPGVSILKEFVVRIRKN